MTTEELKALAEELFASKFQTLSDEDRVMLLDFLTNHFCPNCGQDMEGVWTCHCTNDE